MTDVLARLEAAASKQGLRARWETVALRGTGLRQRLLFLVGRDGRARFSTSCVFGGERTVEQASATCADAMLAPG
ncbi:hypothetical protein [Sphingomonas baiyangensis]|uniref:Uncharacterized protein n=1 Tax=Sphingomonas baiyangensis TaxID=2572576 RepID=A0A4U1L1A2_9SPHN|nr:hypothetical protein [Sphingomonas baiyangensis]TKD50569.1 hypothetical protein FBR43_07170 [Sphingomonas baiyangensis]